jgi:hypothetical protein
MQIGGHSQARATDIADSGPCVDENTDPAIL